jgi:hypothetical protein
MKKKLLLILAMSSGLFLTSQVNISCNTRMDCTWNNVIKEYENCDEYYNNSLFTLSENSMMLTHTVSNNQTTYYLKSNTYIDDGSSMTVDAISDTGREYRFIFDLENKYIFILFEDTSGQVYMVRFTVKTSW